MIGGWIICITHKGPDVTRLWCVETPRDIWCVNECCVDVRNASEMPSVGDNIWWQAGKVYWDNDSKYLEKVGYSYKPHSNQKGATP